MTAGELRHAEDHMLLLGRKTAMERVATFLLEMDRRLARAGMMALPMCRRDIGDYLGLTLETVSRALSQLTTRAFWGSPAPARSCSATAQRLADHGRLIGPSPIRSSSIRFQGRLASNGPPYSFCGAGSASAALAIRTRQTSGPSSRYDHTHCAPKRSAS